MKKLLRSPVPRAQSLLSQQNRYTLSQNLSRERPSTLIAILVMLPLYLECLAIESSEQRKASGTL